MSTLTHRQLGTRSSSMWQQEADDYWKQMEEPGKKFSKGYIGGAVAFGILILTGAAVTLRSSRNDLHPTTLSTVEMIIPQNPALEIDSKAIEQLRGRCRVRGVQTRWHEETCTKLCSTDALNAACMSGCSYGSLTVTKLTCDEIQMTSIPTATTCPESVSCTGACKAYENQQPYPDMRNTCERACSTIVPSACSRVLQIYKDLYKSSSP